MILSGLLLLLIGFIVTSRSDNSFQDNIGGALMIIGFAIFGLGVLSY